MVEGDDHFRTIENAVLKGSRGADADAWRTASWARCLRSYNLDPSHPELVQLEEARIRDERDHFGQDLHIAGLEIEKTLLMIEGGGYSAHITNDRGVIIEDRRSRDQTYFCSMDRVGSLWSEEVGGTNGIGTALVTEKTSAVYLADHFYANMTGQACVGAPFFGPEGQILGVINLSTRNPGLPRLAHRVAVGIAEVTAERLEAQYFRKHYRKYHTIHLDLDGGSPCIMALDDDFAVIGATRAARERFRLGKGALGQKNLWNLFEKLRGEPGFAYLRENLRRLRPLGESTELGAVLMQPQTALARAPGVTVPQIVARAPAAQPAKRGPTLAECAGSDPVMKRNVEVMRRMMGAGLHVLLLGETGVGKDTLARAAHLESDRKGGPFVAFNCAAVPESLIDSELFGYSSGAFTGANKGGSPGRIAEADRGTLFLDEIGDMPLTLQTRLLRFLETQEVSPLGGGKLRHVDVQVMAATHQDVMARVAAGTFRQDLYFRLAGATIHLPALRDRQDIPELIENLLARLPDGSGMKLNRAAMARLSAHDWPGNVRELRNVLNRAIRLADKGEIGPDDLMFDPPIPRPGAAPTQPVARGPKLPRRSALGDAEQSVLRQAIRDSGGDAEICAELVGCSRATLYRKLKTYGLSLT